MKKPTTYAERVQSQFGGFCIRVLKNKSKNIDRELNYRRKHEKPIEELSNRELIGELYFKYSRQTH